MTNAELLRKADLAVADLASGGGMNPEQANTFIRQLLAEPTALRNMRQVVMNSPQRVIDKIGFGQRILRPGVSGIALTQGERAKPTTGRVTLTTKEVLAEVRLPYDVIEDQIMGGSLNPQPGSDPKPVDSSFKDLIISMVVERAALDLEELALLGDTGSGDTYLAMVNGFLKQATSNVVASVGNLSAKMFENGLKTMPSEYLRNREAMRHLISVSNEITYRGSLSERQDQIGTSMFTGVVPVYGYGVPVTPIALMPDDKGLFLNTKNMIFGVQRQISVEVDKDISERVFIIVLTMRVDFKYEEEKAVVKYTGVTQA